MRFCALLLVTAVLSAESVSYVTMKAPVIEERLKLSSPDNATRAEVLRKIFNDAGCTGDHLTDQAVSKKGQPNVICTLPGQTDSVIVVGAHFDTATPSEGVADNWSGAALLPSLFESLKKTPRKHTFVFTAFTDEEKGLVGSKHYVKKLSKAEAANTIAMINLDTIGLGPMNVWLSHSDPELTKLLSSVALTLKVPLTAIEIGNYGTTDSESFATAKIRRIAISSVNSQNLHILHSKEDRFDAMDLTAYYDSYRLMSLYLAYLDQKL